MRVTLVTFSYCVLLLVQYIIVKQESEPPKYEWRDVSIGDVEFIFKETISEKTTCGQHRCPNQAAIERVMGATITKPNGLVYDSIKQRHSFGYWFWKDVDIKDETDFQHFRVAISFVRIWEWTFQHAAMGSFTKAKYFCDRLMEHDIPIIVSNKVQMQVIQTACPPISNSRFKFFQSKAIKVDVLYVFHWIVGGEYNQGVLTLAASPPSIVKLDPSPTVDTLFYMKRDISLGKRYVVNDQQVQEVLKGAALRRGLKYRVFDGDIKELKRAAYLVGPHGGAIANLIYTNDQTKVVEFIPKEGLKKRPCYELLSKTLSLEYHNVEPTTFDFDSGGMVVDIEELRGVFKTRFYASVVTIPGDGDRLADFYDQWGKKWPSLKINRHYCFKHNHKYRSLGVFACVYQILNNVNSNDYDYMLFFEDDGIPFPDTNWPYDLEVRLDEMERQGAEMLLMGGHAIIGDVKSLRKKNLTDYLIHRVRDSSGAYGFVIKANTADRLSKAIEKELIRKKNSKSGIDHYLWNVYKRKGRISVPLLVDHRHGVSNTWGTGKNIPTRKFEGKRDFWNFED